MKRSSRLLPIGGIFILAMTFACRGQKEAPAAEKTQPGVAAETSRFEAQLQGKNEVPESVETEAKGDAVFELSADGQTIHYRLSVDNIREVEAAHIHMGSSEENGPVVAELYASSEPEAEPFSGVLAEGDLSASNLEGPLAGKSIADLVKEMKDGYTYVNVHTKDHPNGELRGKIHIQAT